MPKQPELPDVDLPLTQAQAKRLSMTAFIFGALAIVANGVTAMAFVPVWVMQLCSGLAIIFTALAYYCARQAPSTKAQAAAPKAPEGDEK